VWKKKYGGTTVVEKVQQKKWDRKIAKEKV
jgi:hypothetical protein